MKTKPILIAVIAVIVLAAGGYFIKSKFFSSSGKADVQTFLNNFNEQVNGHNIDSIASYFDSVLYQAPQIKQFVKVLANQSSVVPGEKPQLQINLDVEQSTINYGEHQEAVAIIPVLLTAPDKTTEHTTFTFKLQPAKQHGYSINSVDNNKFVMAYSVFENKFKIKSIPDKDIYADITLKAFKTAEQLKSRYDTVVWFSHINNQTYYYAVKGKWDEYEINADSAKKYKMGLVNPQLQEIIPADFDLVYAIGGTFKDLVEVESDHKRGFYNLQGKVVVPVEYDQILPVKHPEHLAALKKEDKYYWLEQDYRVGAEVDMPINELFALLPPIMHFDVSVPDSKNIIELNSRDYHGSVLISPSYLADLKLFPSIKYLKNPLRRKVEFDDASARYKVNVDNPVMQTDTGRFQALLYSIRDYFIGGRSEFYDSKNLVLVDRKDNRIYSKDILADYGDEGGLELSGKCREFAFKPLNDELLELKAMGATNAMLYDDNYIEEMPMYHYLYMQGGKLQEKETSRLFAFTKFVKMDDSYIQGCYRYKDKQLSEANTEMLRYMKNEIYADYHYKFKDAKWKQIFEISLGGYEAKNVSVEDSLTEIDRYNLNWINQKLKQQPAAAGKLASR
ncbi:YARHG domain-containing protein [Mucilaginibacter sp. Bleaf8]|uniref:WG repeat-containing protein n=1 Tax=Mucilaginibacter sp. Bleaf8 TaxID=2834430 RepID=UPI001BCB5DFB|nr:YARHG domain-containing protein [Mucilaginibacter sp. Bleaf8]MBS7565901.1 YARHG domain-containing protein [Mucilaginibacter sp. Bleaf8]